MSEDREEKEDEELDPGDVVRILKQDAIDRGDEDLLYRLGKMEREGRKRAKELSKTEKGREFGRLIKAHIYTTIPPEGLKQLQMFGEVLNKHLVEDKYGFLVYDDDPANILLKEIYGYTDEEIESYEKIAKIMEKLDTFYKKPCTHRHFVDEVFRCDITDEWCMPEKCSREEVDGVQR